MPESAQPLSPVFAAMSAADEANALHRSLSRELDAALEEAGDLDEAMQRVAIHDHAGLVEAGRVFADALGLVETLVRRLAGARIAVNRAQADLAEARRRQNHARLEELRIELEIDAASIWDLAGQFEAVVRARLEEHAKLAAEMQFVAAAAGERGLSPGAAQELAPALGASGPALWSVLASGVHQKHDDHAQRFGLSAPPAPPPPSAASFEAELLTPSRRRTQRAGEASIEADLKFDFAPPPSRAKPPPVAVPVARIPRPVPPQIPEPSPAPPEIQRGRIHRVLRGLAGIVPRPRRRQR